MTLTSFQEQDNSDWRFHSVEPHLICPEGGPLCQVSHPPGVTPEGHSWQSLAGRSYVFYIVIMYESRNEFLLPVVYVQMGRGIDAREIHACIRHACIRDVRLRDVRLRDVRL